MLTALWKVLAVARPFAAQGHRADAAIVGQTPTTSIPTCTCPWVPRISLDTREIYVCMSVIAIQNRSANGPAGVPHVAL